MEKFLPSHRGWFLKENLESMVSPVKGRSGLGVAQSSPWLDETQRDR